MTLKKNWKMQKIIISDTSCLILFNKIQQLDLLHNLFGEIIITPEIETEYLLHLPSWIKVQKHRNINYNKILQFTLDPGEASAIALALEYKNCLLIVDDNKARKASEQLNIEYLGSLGLLIKAKELKKIRHVKPYLDLILKTDFRITDELISFVLKTVGEN